MSITLYPWAQLLQHFVWILDGMLILSETKRKVIVYFHGT